MNSFLKFKKSKNKTGENYKKFRDKTFFDPNRDWKIIVISFAFLVLLIACADSYMYFRVYKGDIFTVQDTTDTSLTVVDQKSLTDVTATFETKAKDFETLKGQKPVNVDPSL